ncbi:MAG TPA: nucleotidyltransferase domain-containing protein [Chitinophagales bacterium]|jgi:predicted nucleotidyltransferase|nr:nucleotidyltransferase domain-containing protein [Chitinophagales bacterium]
MENKIKEQLKLIENEKGIKILLACETGSRAWGFPSPDSDYDVRIIYKHQLDWYLSLNEKKDTIEIMLEDGNLDITGWDIRKCLRLLWKSNGALLERIQSPIVYLEEDNISQLLYQYAAQCFSPIATIYHYLGLAKNSFADVEHAKEVKLKKLFYALRATLSSKWIIDKNSIPPIVFMTMVDELDFDDDLKIKIKELVALKALKNESYMHYEELKINDFIRNEVDQAEHKAKGLSGMKNKNVDLDSLFLEIIKKY